MTSRKTEAARVANDQDEAGGASAGAWEAENNLSFRINHLHRLLDRQTKRHLSENYGLTTAEWYVLAFLARHATEKVAVIAERTFIFKSQVSHAIGALMRAGYVSRRDDPKDGRSPYFSISTKGRQIHRTISRWTTLRQHEFIAQLAPDERRAVYAGLDTLTRYLKRELDGES